jgi:hypothetical protein
MWLGIWLIAVGRDFLQLRFRVRFTDLYVAHISQRLTPV